jgi:hypothetical protein
VSRKVVDPRFAPGAMQRADAAWYCGMSVDHFRRHVMPNVPNVYIGDVRLYRTCDLEAWLERHAIAPARLPRDKRPGAAVTARGRPKEGSAP